MPYVDRKEFLDFKERLKGILRKMYARIVNLEKRLMQLERTVRELRSEIRSAAPREVEVPSPEIEAVESLTVFEEEIAPAEAKPAPPPKPAPATAVPPPPKKEEVPPPPIETTDLEKTVSALAKELGLRAEELKKEEKPPAPRVPELVPGVGGEKVSPEELKKRKKEVLSALEEIELG